MNIGKWLLETHSFYADTMSEDRELDVYITAKCSNCGKAYNCPKDNTKPSPDYSYIPIKTRLRWWWHWLWAKPNIWVSSRGRTQAFAKTYMSLKKKLAAVDKLGKKHTHTCEICGSEIKPQVTVDKDGGVSVTSESYEIIDKGKTIHHRVCSNCYDELK